MPRAWARPTMREHDFSADETTLNALRKLRESWRGWESEDGVVRVQASDGVVVRLLAERGEPERGFHVRRVAADFERGAVRPVRAVAGFDAGGNDVVILEGESWLTRLTRPAAGREDDDATAPDDALVTHGHPRERPDDVDARCATTDGVLVASPRGILWLVRLGARADALEVLTDPGLVRDYLAARGYRT
jgi:hypothetical protein